MRYISPASFLPSAAIESVTVRDLKLAQQKMLAEFELTGSTTIDLAGHVLTRNDVVTLFDRLLHKDDLSYHALVASDEVLRHFLEHGDIARGERFILETSKLPPGFMEWLSPYFCAAFRAATVRMFRQERGRAFETLMANPLLMDKNATSEAWLGVEYYVDGLYHDLKALLTVKVLEKDAVYRCCGYDIIWLLSCLPVERFRAFLDRYAFEILRLSVVLFNRGNREAGIELLANAKMLPVKEDRKIQLEAKYKELIGLVRIRYIEPTWLYSPVPVFLVGVALTLLVLMLSGA